MMWRFCGWLVLWLVIAAAVADTDKAAKPAVPVIAIVLDDLGNNLAMGRAALALPGKLTYAFLPHTPYAEMLARQAHASARESIVHLPMQSLSDGALGPGGLTLDMSEAEMLHTLTRNMQSVPFAVGASNHMGSSLTGDMDAMLYLMAALAERGDTYFLDSRTHDSTVAELAAHQVGVPASRRDVFLDSQRDQTYINAQLNLLLHKAQQQGSAVAIGHPYPETLGILARRLPELDDLGVELAPLSFVIERQQAENSVVGLHNPVKIDTNSNMTTNEEDGLDATSTDTARPGL